MALNECQLQLPGSPIDASLDGTQERCLHTADPIGTSCWLSVVQFREERHGERTVVR